VKELALAIRNTENHL